MLTLSILVYDCILVTNIYQFSFIFAVSDSSAAYCTGIAGVGLSGVFAEPPGHSQNYWCDIPAANPLWNVERMGLCRIFHQSDRRKLVASGIRTADHRAVYSVPHFARLIFVMETNEG